MLAGKEDHDQAGHELLAGKERQSIGGRDFLAGEEISSPGDVGCLPASKTCPPGMLIACRQAESVFGGCCALAGKQADGRYLLRLKARWRDGTTHLLFEPIELMERLAAQIPKPRVNLVLYAGVLAPHAKLRADAVVHARPEPLPEPPATETQTRSERDSWSELRRATFGLDVLECPRCGGRLKYIATILDGRVARRILEHLRRPARAPPVAPAHDPVPFWDAVEAETWH